MKVLLVASRALAEEALPDELVVEEVNRDCQNSQFN